MSKFDSNDFTVVLQPFFLGAPSPDNVNTIFGQAPDLSLFAPDCFHFSQKSNALGESLLKYWTGFPFSFSSSWQFIRFPVANALWNNMLEPVGNKTRGWQPLMERFLCPTENAPYFFTRRNSETFLRTGHQWRVPIGKQQKCQPSSKIVKKRSYRSLIKHSVDFIYLLFSNT